MKGAVSNLYAGKRIEFGLLDPERVKNYKLQTKATMGHLAEYLTFPSFLQRK